MRPTTCTGRVQLEVGAKLSSKAQKLRCNCSGSDLAIPVREEDPEPPMAQYVSPSGGELIVMHEVRT